MPFEYPSVGICDSPSQVYVPPLIITLPDLIAIAESLPVIFALPIFQVPFPAAYKPVFFRINNCSI